MLLEGPQTYSTEVEGESYAFDEIRELAEAHGAAPGKAFITELDLSESLGEIIVEHMYVEFGQLEIDEDAKQVWAELIENSLPLTVRARIWTSRDWEDDFYASVKVDLPTVEDAEAQADAALKAHLVETYGTEDPTVEQLQRRHEEVEREADEALAEAARTAANPYGAPAATPPAPASPPWFELLAPDGTPRATIHQRGYARGVAGKAMGNAKAPRIDYATVGQCKRIVGYFGGDVGEVDKRGGALLKTLWWVLLGLLGIVALIGVVTPPVGWILTGLIVWPFAQHYITRRKLQPPFGPQK